MFKKKADVEMDPETQKELALAFKLYDDRSVGSISGPDLKSVLRAYGFTVKKANVRDLMKKANLEYEEPINFADFLAIMGEVLPKRHSKEHYERIFKIFDSEGRGKIAPNSIIDVAESVG
jgi:centrin-3